MLASCVVSCLALRPTQKKETCIDFRQTTQCYITEDRSNHKKMQLFMHPLVRQEQVSTCRACLQGFENDKLIYDMEKSLTLKQL
jgi:hypothetical protein